MIVFSHLHLSADELELPKYQLTLYKKESVKKNIKGSKAPVTRSSEATCHELELYPLVDLNCGASKNLARRNLNSIYLIHNSTTSLIKIKVDLNEISNKFEDVLNLVAQTPTGKKIVEAFIEKIKKKNLTVAEMTPVYQGALITTQKALYEPDTHIMYIDYSGEIGVIAVDLAHEMIHSLDFDMTTNLKQITALEEKYQKMVKEVRTRTAKSKGVNPEKLKPKDYSQKDLEVLVNLKNQIQRELDRYHFRAERKAFNEHEKFIKELTERFPCYKTYLKIKESEEEVDLKHRSDEEIVIDYGLKREYVKDLIKEK